MSAVVDFLEDAIAWSIEKIEAQASLYWNVFFVKPLEVVVGLMGIVDEDVIIVQKASNAIHSSNTVDPIETAQKRAVISMTRKGGSFFNWYNAYTGVTSTQIAAFYRYAKNGNYSHGLPSAEIRSGDVDYPAIDAALDTEKGVACTRLSAYTNIPSHEVYFKDKLQAAPTYFIPWQNTLTHDDPGAVSRDDYKITSITFNAGTGNYEIAIRRLDDLGEPVTDIIVEPNYVPERSLVVTYHVTASPSTEWFYWVYKLSDVTYPGIDSSISVLSNMEMLPVAVLKKEGVATNADKESAEYRTTKKLLAILDLDIDSMTSNLASGADYANIEDCYVNFAVCPNSTDEVVSQALWLTMYNIIVVNAVEGTIDNYIATFVEQDINNAMVWGSHSHTAGKVGTITGGGEYHHEYELIPELSHYDAGLEETVVTQEESSNLWIRHQTSPGVYSEILVYGLNGMSAIEKNGMWDMALYKLGEDNFTIPLSHYVLQELSRKDQMLLYQHILRVDVYAAQIVHLEFYETTTFGQLFEFVSIVVTVYSLGTAGSAFNVLKQILFQYIIGELVSYLAKVTGNAELAAVVGMVAMLALSGKGDSLFSFTSAEELIKASTNFANNLTTAYGVEIEEIKEEMDALNTEATARMEEIDDATVDINPISSEFLVALQSVDTVRFPAISAQYDFDLIYNYDRLIKDYYDLNFRTGVS